VKFFLDLVFSFSLGTTTCLNSTATGSSGPAATTGASSPSSGAASSGTTSSTSSQSKAGDTGSSYVSHDYPRLSANSHTSTSKAATPSSSGNAAIVAGIPYGMAGVLGAVVAAVFV
jgi:hypothetical protein